jgi:signal transduction histidine kinase
VKLRSHTQALRRLANETLHATDPQDLARLLTHSLPAALELDKAALLLWDRKLETFEGLSLGEGGVHPVGDGGVRAPEARYLVADGQIVETPGQGEGSLVPLMARSGLVGMLVLGPQKHRRRLPFRPAEARLLSAIADHAALALENYLYQKELIASERVAALGTMAGMLAHDFRGPMTVIRGYAETLLEDGGLPAQEVRERARLIVDSVDRLERMTGETLDFVRGSTKLVRRTVVLTTLVKELAAGVSEELPGLDVTTDAELPRGLSAALDVDKLQRAISNIAANACDAMGGRGRLAVQARIELTPVGDGNEPWLALLIGDEGPGVADAIRDKLFQPFATFGKKKGTGLGLAVSRRFVEDHGGTLELLPNPPPPDHGARFRIALPIGSPVPAGGPV